MRVLVTSALMRNRDGNVTTKPDNRLSVNVESMFRLVNFRSDTTEVPMKSLTNSPHQELVWSQPQLAARFYELRDDCDLYATLKWERSTGSLAHGESDDGKWSFKRSGFLRPRVIVRELGSSSDLATFEAGWAGGRQLLFADGHGYYWRQRSFWHNEWAFENERSEIVAQFQTELFRLKQKAAFRLLPQASLQTDRPLPATLGMYLMILSNDDAAIVSIVAIS